MIYVTVNQPLMSLQQDWPIRAGVIRGQTDTFAAARLLPSIVGSDCIVHDRLGMFSYGKLLTTEVSI